MTPDAAGCASETASKPRRISFLPLWQSLHSMAAGTWYGAPPTVSERPSPRVAFVPSFDHT